MVGTAAELPSVQMHGPVGLGGDHQSDNDQEEPRSGTLSLTAPHCQVCDAVPGQRTQHCRGRWPWAGHS